MATGLHLLLLDTTPLRRSHSFRWLWLGDLFFTLSRQMIVVAVPLQVYGLTGSSLAVGLSSLAQLVPLIIGSLVGGVVVDALDRRRVLLITQALLCSMGIGFAINAQISNGQLWVVFVLAILQAWISGFDSPARRAALPTVVGSDMLASALALQQIVNNLNKLVGPALAGVLIAFYGLPVAYWIYVACFAATLLTTARLPSLNPEGGGRKAGWSSLVEGLGYVRKQRTVRSIFFVDMSAMVFGLPRALFPAIGTTVLGGGAATVGLLYAAPGLGALIAALISGWLSVVRRPGFVILTTVGIYGGAMVGFGFSRWIPLSVAFLALAGASDIVSAVLRNTLIQLSTPDSLRGRVNSVNKAVVSGGPLVGDARAGAMAELAGPAFSVLTGGAACLVSLFCIAVRYPDLRQARIQVEPLKLGGSGDSAASAESQRPLDKL